MTDLNRKPLATYDFTKDEAPKYDYALVAWAAVLDKRYKIEVQRDTKGGDMIHAQYNGFLVIFDSQDNDKVILDEKVPISYGAVFGPDAIDVAEWQEMACEAVDKLKKL
jgi:hypothetical protein